MYLKASQEYHAVALHNLHGYYQTWEGDSLLLMQDVKYMSVHVR